MMDFSQVFFILHDIKYSVSISIPSAVYQKVTAGFFLLLECVSSSDCSALLH